MDVLANAEEDVNADLVEEDNNGIPAATDSNEHQNTTAPSNTNSEVYVDTTLTGHVYRLKENNGFIKKRSKSLVIRYFKEK